MTTPRTTRLACLTAALLAPALGGCVSQQEYDQVSSTNRTVEDRNVTLQQELESRDLMIAQMREHMNNSDSALSDARDRNATLQSDLLRLREDYRQLGERLGQVAGIDPATERALRRLAAQNPEVFSFDAARGMILLKSDLTFGSGSDQLTSTARQGLQQLAQVLSSVDASAYDLQITGHTDNQNISNEATRRRHPSNLHLSAHRAISVRAALREFGIAPQRMMVSGWGSHRPAVPHNPRGGTAENRRVEIMLIPSTAGGDLAGAGASAPAQVNPPQQRTEAESDFPMK